MLFHRVSVATSTVESIVHFWTLMSFVCYCLSWPSQTGRRLGHLASTSIPLLGSSSLEWYTRSEIYSTRILYLLQLKRTILGHCIWRVRMTNKLIPEYKRWLHITFPPPKKTECGLEQGSSWASWGTMINVYKHVVAIATNSFPIEEGHAGDCLTCIDSACTPPFFSISFFSVSITSLWRYSRGN